MAVISDEVSRLQKTVERLERDKAEIEYVKQVLLDKTRRHVKRIQKIRDDIKVLGTNRFDKQFGLLYNPKK